MGARLQDILDREVWRIGGRVLKGMRGSCRGVGTRVAQRILGSLTFRLLLLLLLLGPLGRAPAAPGRAVAVVPLRMIVLQYSQGREGLKALVTTSGNRSQCLSLCRHKQWQSSLASAGETRLERRPPRCFGVGGAGGVLIRVARGVLRGNEAIQDVHGRAADDRVFRRAMATCGETECGTAPP